MMPIDVPLVAGTDLRFGGGMLIDVAVLDFDEFIKVPVRSCSRDAIV